jgi:hypothetical protein
MRAPSIARLVAVTAASVMLAACSGSGGGGATSADVATPADKPVGGSPAPKNSAPTIEGSPRTAVTVSSTYEFQPMASDADGDTVSFTIVNKPAWAAFDAATGRLSGSPGAADVGIYANIRLTVSDGKASSSLPAFSITVAKGFTDAGFDKDADFQARVAYSKAWYVNNFGDYATLEEALRDNESNTGGDMTMEGRRDLNTDPAFALSGDKSLKLTITPTGKPAGSSECFFHQASAAWIAEGWRQRSRVLPAVRDLLDPRGNDLDASRRTEWRVVQDTAARRVRQRSVDARHESAHSRGSRLGKWRRMVAYESVKTPRGGERPFYQSSLDDPAVILTEDSRLEDYIAKHGLRRRFATIRSGATSARRPTGATRVAGKRAATGRRTSSTIPIVVTRTAAGDGPS